MTSESDNIAVEESLQVTEFSFLSKDEEGKVQRYDMASPHSFANWQ